MSSFAPCARFFPTQSVLTDVKFVETAPCTLASMSCISRTQKACWFDSSDLFYSRHSQSGLLMGVAGARCACIPSSPPKLTHSKWAAFVHRKDSVPNNNNNGWPGCCRPPQQCEFKMISAVDWKAVNIVFSVPIPLDVRHVLDAIAAASPASRRATPPLAKSLPPSANGTVMPPFLTSRTNSSSREKTPAVAISSKGIKESPKQNAAALGSVKSAAGSVSSSSAKSSPILESQHGHRHRQLESGASAVKEKRSESTKSSHSSPSNTSRSLEGEILASSSPRKVATIRRNSATSSSADGASRTGGNAQDASGRHRSAMTSSPMARSAALAATGCASGQQAQSSPKQSSSVSATLTRNSKPEEDDRESNSGSSDGPSIGSGSLSDGTVTSDGGFTDYLSDESEAELQRQAEARAALLAQNQMEEMEFRAVRQRLAHVDLRPPKSWNPTNITSAGSMRLAGGSKVWYQVTWLHDSRERVHRHAPFLILDSSKLFYLLLIWVVTYCLLVMLYISFSPVLVFWDTRFIFFINECFKMCVVA